MIEENLKNILSELPSGVKLVAVSKFHPFEAILMAYQAGQKVFGENRPQEFYRKVLQLPQDIEWHFIGHLQTNKLKLVLPYASLVESIDSFELLDAVAEATKGGFTETEIEQVLSNTYSHVRFHGLMGMATNTDDESVIRADFKRIQDFKLHLNAEHPELSDFTELSIGMSHDWKIALEYGATIVRIGTAIFGPRQY